MWQTDNSETSHSSITRFEVFTGLYNVKLYSFFCFFKLLNTNGAHLTPQTTFYFTFSIFISLSLSVSFGYFDPTKHLFWQTHEDQEHYLFFVQKIDICSDYFCHLFILHHLYRFVWIVINTMLYVLCITKTCSLTQIQPKVYERQNFHLMDSLST